MATATATATAPLRRRFKVLPGAEITMDRDFTGLVLEQYGDAWLEDPRVPGSYVLRQPATDVRGQHCAAGCPVSISSHLLSELLDC